MKLKEINTIEKILKNNKEEKDKALSQFTKEISSAKLIIEENGCEEEKYKRLLKELNEANTAYTSFTEHNWI